MCTLDFGILYQRLNFGADTKMMLLLIPYVVEYRHFFNKTQTTQKLNAVYTQAAVHRLCLK